MAETHRHGGDWITGAHVHGRGGGGVLAQNVPSTGTDGPPPAYPYLSFPADNDKEVCTVVTRMPSTGVLDMGEDGSFKFTAPDGADSFDYKLLVDYVERPTTGFVGLGIGVPPPTIPPSTITLTGKNAVQVNLGSSGSVIVSPFGTVNLAASNATQVNLGSTGAISIDSGVTYTYIPSPLRFISPSRGNTLISPNRGN